MRPIQSLPTRIACSEYSFTVGDFRRNVWIAIYSPNYQNDGLASHWQSRVLLQDSSESTVGSISGKGACSFQALSSSIYMTGYKLLEISNCSNEICFSDIPESRVSVLSLLATDSSSIIETNESCKLKLDSPVIAETDMSIYLMDDSDRKFSIAISEPVFEDDNWYCSVELIGLDYCQTYTSRDSTRVLAKTLRGLHRKLLEFSLQGIKLKDSEGNWLEEKNLWCCFYSTEQLLSCFSNTE